LSSGQCVIGRRLLEYLYVYSSFWADVAICRNGQVIEQSDGAFGNVLPVLTDCFSRSSFAMTGFFERKSNTKKIPYRGAPA
jgi:hypothetical protein